MTPLFKVADLTCRADGFVLGPMNFQMEARRKYVLAGPHGSGKTPILRCLAGQLVPDGGRMELDGASCTPDDCAWRRNVAFMPDRVLFHEWMTVDDHLAYLTPFYPSWSVSRAAELIARFDLDLNSRIHRLSSLQRMYLSLASALACRPKLLLVDEPGADLRGEVRREVFDALASYSREDGMAVLLATGTADDLHLVADEVLFIAHGEVALQTRKEELLESWRRFELPDVSTDVPPAGVVRVDTSGSATVVVSESGEATRQALAAAELKATSEQAMTLEEIVVHQMRNLDRVPDEVMETAAGQA